MRNRVLALVATAMLGWAGTPILADEIKAAEELRPVKPAAESGRAYTKPAPLTFVRIRDGMGGSPAALQVAIVKYVPVDGSRLSVTLYGAVHVGDEEYYRRLNGLFRQHEALLYELANDPEVLHQRDRGEPSILSMLQMDMGETLGLADQLEEIDYTRPNFVHADMPMDELFTHAQEQGDDALTVAAQTLLDVQRMMNRGDDAFSALMGGSDSGAAGADPLAAMLGIGQDPLELKQQLARQLVQQTRDGILEGITVLNRYLIAARNARCLEVLDEQIRQGRHDLGIFYGAGHNPDFHRRLMADYGLRPVEVTWVDAWDLTQAPQRKKRPADELSDQELLMSLMRRMLDE